MEGEKEQEKEEQGKSSNVEDGGKEQGKDNVDNSGKEQGNEE